MGGAVKRVNTTLYLSDEEQQDIINEMNSEIHPENFCWKCGHPNPMWVASNKLWNEVMERREDIICPKCFQELAEEKGINLIITVKAISDE